MRLEIAVHSKDLRKTICGSTLVDYILSNLNIKYIYNENTIIVSDASCEDIELIKSQFKIEEISYKLRIGEFISILRYKQKNDANILHFKDGVLK